MRKPEAKFSGMESAFAGDCSFLSPLRKKFVFFFGFFVGGF